jgi:hypothetical protein
MPNFGPGTYTVTLNAQDKPALIPPGMTTPIDHVTFETCGGTFLFVITDESLPEPLTFHPIPITWHSQGELIPPPSGNSTSLDGNTLTLTVSPPEELQTHHFGLHFNLGDIALELWSADGLRPLDPTIIEKPPIMGS